MWRIFVIEEMLLISAVVFVERRPVHWKERENRCRTQRNLLHTQKGVIPCGKSSKRKVNPWQIVLAENYPLGNRTAITIQHDHDGDRIECHMRCFYSNGSERVLVKKWRRYEPHGISK